MYRLAIFDFDGTLADSSEWFIEAMIAAAGRFGYRQVALDEIGRLRGLPTREVVRQLGVPFWRMPAIARHFRAEAQKNLHRIQLFPGAREALRSLAAGGVEIAILSSNSEQTIRAVLGPCDAALVRRFACGASLFGKAAKLRRLVRESGVSPEEAIAIGDETRDVDAAGAAGVAAGAVDWGYATPAVLRSAEPELIFASFEKLVSAVLGEPQAATDLPKPLEFPSPVPVSRTI